MATAARVYTLVAASFLPPEQNGKISNLINVYIKSLITLETVPKFKH
jgi:hypothetical protein